MLNYNRFLIKQIAILSLAISNFKGCQLSENITKESKWYIHGIMRNGLVL